MRAPTRSSGRAALGATRVVDVTRESLADVVPALTDGRGADVTFECTGTQAALSGVRRRDPDERHDRDRRLPPGRRPGRSRWPTGTGWRSRSSTPTSARSRTIMRGMTVGMRLLASGVLSMDGLVTHRFPLEEINEAFATLRDKPDGFVEGRRSTFPTVGPRVVQARGPSLRTDCRARRTSGAGQHDGAARVVVAPGHPAEQQVAGGACRPRTAGLRTVVSCGVDDGGGVDVVEAHDRDVVGHRQTRARGRRRRPRSPSGRWRRRRRPGRCGSASSCCIAS